MGGFAAGGAIGLKAKSAPMGIGMGALFAFMAAMVDVSGESFTGKGMVDDGATPPPKFLPYPSNTTASQTLQPDR